MVKVLSVAVTLQLTDFWYQRCSELVNNRIGSHGFEQGLVAPHRHLWFGLACTSFGQNNIQSHRFEDKEDLFIHDIDAFDDFEAWKLSKFGSAGSVFFYIYSKTQLNADFWSYSKVTRQVVKGLDTAATALSAGQQIYNFFKPPVSQNNIKSCGFEDNEDLFVREIDAFDNLKAREPSTGNYRSAASVFFYIYGSKMQISGHIAKHLKKHLKLQKKSLHPKLWKVSAQLWLPSASDSKFPAFSIPMVRIISNPVNLKTRKTVITPRVAWFLQMPRKSAHMFYQVNFSNLACSKFFMF